MPALFYVSQAILWLFVIGEGILLLLLYRHFGLMALDKLDAVQRDGLRVGATAPSITGVTVQGDQTVWEPTIGRSHLVAFVSPDCGPCVQILPHITTLQVAGRALDVTLVVDGPREKLVQLMETFGPPSSFTCLAEDVSETMQHPYQVRVTPFAFLIEADGHILAKGLCDKPARLRKILAAGAFETAMALEHAPQRLSVVMDDG